MRQEIVDQLTESGVIAVVRMADTDKLKRVVAAVREGGVYGIEITMTTPGALRVIKELSDAMGAEVLVGVGSVLDVETARRAIEAGARYVVSPIFDPDIIAEAHHHDVPVMPGALTPTEIHRATEAGADIVKVFPAEVVGIDYFSAVRAPMPHLRLMPTGGVSVENAGDWIRAGAVAVGVGSALFDRRAIAENDFAALTERARALCRAVDDARAEA